MNILIYLFTFFSLLNASATVDISKRYNEISFLTTHNSYNYAWRKEQVQGRRYYLFPNQNNPIKRQLNSGVRALMLDLHYYRGFRKKHQGQVIMCHGGKGCDFLGYELAINIFKDIKEFLEKNPEQIITLILESYVKADDLHQLIVNSKLEQFLHRQHEDQPWPTISEMIKHNSRLVILNDRIEHSNPLWNHDLFGKFAVETHYSFSSPKKFNCDFNRGSSDHSLFILNHFITRISGTPLIARKINQKEVLLKRIEDCKKLHNRMPNFIVVDFYEYGDSLEVVEILNKNMEN